MYQLHSLDFKTNTLLLSTQLTSREDSPVTTSADIIVGTPCKTSTSLQRISSRQTPKHKKQDEEYIHLRISSSWLGRVWEIGITNGFNTFGIQLRMHNTVPEDALVFQYAEKGDVNGLQRLFHCDSKQASVHDRDHVLGQTPLHVSFFVP